MNVCRLPGFMGQEFIERLLAHCEQCSGDFAGTTTIGNAAGVRLSVNLPEFSEFREAVEQRVLEHLPVVRERLGIPAFEVACTETELVAHIDGAFYKRHIDVFTGKYRDSAGGDRIITFVWYFFTQPRAFEGGSLRIYPDAGFVPPERETVLDIEVENDLALAFSSWLPHEVRPVQVPSGRFMDSRFAVNCWLRRAVREGNGNA